ncbi:MAG: hypothetical protein AAFZ04_09030 [Pseudomonadota bacterium]
MSDTDSFIEEVTEEVRREKLFKLVRRYGWIAVLLVVLLVGGATWFELRKAAAQNEAQAFGDAILSALSAEDRAERADGLTTIEAPTPGADAMLTLLTAAELGAENPAEAAQNLLTLSDRSDIPQIYRSVATLKAVMIPGSGLDPQERRARLEALEQTGGMMRIMAGEQIAMLEIEEGNTEAAISRLQALFEDAESSEGLRERARGVIVALGGEVPE